MDTAQTIPAVLPLMIDRECGGWLATTPEDSPLRIGVTADTESDARALFEASLDRWRELLSGGRLTP